MSPTSYQLLHPATESLIIRQRLCVSSGKKEKTRKKKNSFSPLCPPPQNEAPPTQPARPQPHRRPKAWALRKHRKSEGRIIARLARLSKPRIGRPGGGTLALPPRRAAPRFLRAKQRLRQRRRALGAQAGRIAPGVVGKAPGGGDAGVGESPNQPPEALSRKNE